MKKRIGIIRTATLFLALGLAAQAHARPQEKPEKQEPEKQQEAKPAQPRQQAKPATQPKAQAPQPRQQAKPETQPQAKTPQPQQQAKPATQQQAKAPQPRQQVQPAAQPQRQAAASHAPQRTPQAIAAQRAMPAVHLSARGTGRIPADRFQANFGHNHMFHMGNPVMVGGFSRFQYGGFWFGFVQPWPAGWYYTDNVYIDYVGGGYYMYDPYHPGARFAISVVL